MDELLQRLAEVSIRQQQIVEHLATRQGETEREMAALRTAARQHVSLPDPRVQARVESYTRLKRVSGMDKALLPSTSIIRVIRVNICARIE